MSKNNAKIIRLDMWKSEVQYGENGMRTDATLTFKVSGITEGNTSTLAECIECDPSTLTDKDIIDLVERVGSGVSDAFHPETISWGYNKDKDFILVTANLHLTEPDMDDIKPEVTRITEWAKEFKGEEDY